ncbi:MAG: ATP-dependent DNA helicase RecG [Blautia sp.]|nr:ATP-dependent DNA helicase RecG [Blautia sp.]
MVRNDELQSLKGLGEKTQKLLEKTGVHTVTELIHQYPREYVSYAVPVPASQVKEGSLETVETVLRGKVNVSARGGKTIVTAALGEPDQKLEAIWYNTPYLRALLKPRCKYVFRGKTVRKRETLVFEHPEVFTIDEYALVQGRLLPVYPLTKGLSNKTVRRMVKLALDSVFITESENSPGIQVGRLSESSFADYLPESMRERLSLTDLKRALCGIHFPGGMEELLQAKKRLAFDELFLFILAIRIMKGKSETEQNAYPMERMWETRQAIDALPYRLTKAQENAFGEIETDLCSHTRMARLVQGDVGSGKTIIAFLAIYQTILNGYQAALMVPTEVLAVQHYEDLKAFFRSLGREDIEIILLTGSVKGTVRRKALEKISSQTMVVVVGTHALIQEGVEYRELGLAVIDEQHRFGVRQRHALTFRERPAHLLVMSATPIPRTLALILYGDLDISAIDEMPKNRIPIKNCVVNPSWRPNAYAFIAKQVGLGHQAYVICPMVEENDEIEAENVTDYAAALRLQLPEDICVDVLHGRMKAKEKDRIMARFSGGEIQVLVSTTVIEVGVNVPNAVVMMIENAERFGLAQLHQLRGRVGRGQDQSYCIFVQGNGASETDKRLELIGRSNDGFFLANEDLKLRGPGDFFGVRQSGELMFQIADIYRDADLAKSAAAEADALLKEDPFLEAPEHKRLAGQMEAFLSRDGWEL